MLMSFFKAAVIKPPSAPLKRRASLIGHGRLLRFAVKQFAGSRRSLTPIPFGSFGVKQQGASVSVCHGALRPSDPKTLQEGAETDQ